MIRIFTSFVMLCAVSAPAHAQGFTVTNSHGGTVERSRTSGNGELNRSVERTTASGKTMGREISLEKTGPGEASRSVTGTGPNGRSHTRGVDISRR